MFDVEAIAWLKDLSEKRNKAQNAIGSARDDARDALANKDTAGEMSEKKDATHDAVKG
jgi:hypothetical protein